MKKILITSAIALAAFVSIAAKESHDQHGAASSQQLDQLMSEIRFKEEQIKKLVQEVHNLKVKHAKAEAIHNNHQANNRSRSLAADMKNMKERRAYPKAPVMRPTK